MKKFRKIYWHMRDCGKGKQFILFVLVFVLGLGSMGGLIGKNVYVSIRNHREEMRVKRDVSTDVSADATTDATVVSEAAVSGDSSVDEQMQEVTSPNTSPDVSPEKSVDVSGMSGFLGFMTDDAYASLEQQIQQICQSRQCSSAKKLNYQETEDGTFEVRSFILLSDGSIYQCDYNLKSTAVSIAETSYTESEINAKNEEQKKAEQEALKKQQAKDKKKLEAAKKKKSAAKKAAKKKAAKKKTKKTTKKK